MDEIIDCHYCRYAWCPDKEGIVDCHAEDDCYFAKHIKDSKKEAEDCWEFEFDPTFPKL